MSNVGWLPEQEVTAWRLWMSGKSWNEVGKAVHKSGYAVRTYFKRRGWDKGGDRAPKYARIRDWRTAPGRKHVQLCWTCRKANGR